MILIFSELNSYFLMKLEERDNYKKLLIKYKIFYSSCLIMSFIGIIIIIISK